ncbi:Cytochrome P450 4C1, partial [Trachymyrmex cornetzi]
VLFVLGDKWHSRRKILTPPFHYNILQQFTEILIEQSKNMTKCLKNTEGTVVKDLISFVSEYTLNIICETAMGTSLQDLNAFQQQYRKAVHRMTELMVYRFFRPWLHFDWIFSLTSKGREQKKILKILHRFTEHIIAERRLYHERTNGQYLKEFDNLSAQRDDNETIGTRRKRLAMLDLLIAASREGLMTDIDIREEVDAFVFAGYDTVAIAVSFILAQLAEHKDIQDRARNEVDSAIQGNEEQFTFKLLQQLPYLERCIKEALRLYSSAPLISRICGEDVKLQSYLVPAGTTINMIIYAIHRNSNFWPNPEVFNPDRFLPEKIRNRHPYSYISFSAGPRNCIGQRFAMLEMKAMIASVIHNFYLEPIDYLKDVRLQADITLCPTQPLRIRFIPIHKINVRI